MTTPQPPNAGTTGGRDPSGEPPAHKPGDPITRFDRSAAVAASCIVAARVAGSSSALPDALEGLLNAVQGLKVLENEAASDFDVYFDNIDRFTDAAALLEAGADLLDVQVPGDPPTAEHFRRNALTCCEAAMARIADTEVEVNDGRDAEVCARIVRLRARFGDQWSVDLIGRQYARRAAGMIDMPKFEVDRQQHLAELMAAAAHNYAAAAEEWGPAENFGEVVEAIREWRRTQPLPQLAAHMPGAEPGTPEAETEDQPVVWKQFPDRKARAAADARLREAIARRRDLDVATIRKLGTIDHRGPLVDALGPLVRRLDRTARDLSVLRDKAHVLTDADIEAWLAHASAAETASLVAYIVGDVDTSARMTELAIQAATYVKETVYVHTAHRTYQGADFLVEALFRIGRLRMRGGQEDSAMAAFDEAVEQGHVFGRLSNVGTDFLVMTLASILIMRDPGRAELYGGLLPYLAYTHDGAVDRWMRVTYGRGARF